MRSVQVVILSSVGTNKLMKSQVSMRVYIYNYIYIYLFIYLFIGYIPAQGLYQIYKNRSRGRGFYKSDIARVHGI